MRSVPSPSSARRRSAGGGALDILLVRSPDEAEGTVRSSDWHVVFGASQLISAPAPILVNVKINGIAVDAMQMVIDGALQPAKFMAQRGASGPGSIVNEAQATAVALDIGVSSSTTAEESPERAAVAGAAATKQTVTVTPSEAVLRDLIALGTLREGRNEVIYEAGDGSMCAMAFAYLCHVDSKVVVFDIDGTFTTSDIGGHLGQAFDFPVIHSGVCEFLCHLHARGYIVMFLTARCLLGAAGIDRTRRFLFEIARDAASGYCAPVGPIFTTRHTSTFDALRDELSKASGVFKFRQLRQIAALFGQSPSPTVGASSDEAATANAKPTTRGGLYAGFGNRSKDAIAYMNAGIECERIFIINTASRIHRWRGSTRSSSQPKAVPQSVHGERTGIDRPWTSYLGFLKDVETPFPRLVSESQLEQMLSWHASVAARARPSSALGHAYRLRGVSRATTGSVQV